MKVYLCGPVSLGGTLSEEQVQANLQRFHDAEKELIEAGYEVENPANIKEHVTILALPLPDHEAERIWSWYMRRTLIQMLLCEAVVTLPNYQFSPGCRLEIINAVQLGMPVFRLIGRELLPVVQ